MAPPLCPTCAGAVCDSPCAANATYTAAGQQQLNEILNGQGYTTAEQSLAGVFVRRHVFAPQAGQSDSDKFLRYVDELTNRGNVPVTVMVRIGSVGNDPQLSDGTERIWKTSSDDSTFEASDRWLAVDDGAVNGGLPTTGVLIQGAGNRGSVSAPQVISNDFGDAVTLSWDFRNITIQPATTVRIMTVLVMEEQRQNAYDELENLMRAKPIDLLVGLTDDERGEIWNFA